MVRHGKTTKLAIANIHLQHSDDHMATKGQSNGADMLEKLSQFMSRQHVDAVILAGDFNNPQIIAQVPPKKDVSSLARRKRSRNRELSSKEETLENFDYYSAADEYTKRGKKKSDSQTRGAGSRARRNPTNSKTFMRELTDREVKKLRRRGMKQKPTANPLVKHEKLGWVTSDDMRLDYFFVSGNVKLERYSNPYMLTNSVEECGSDHVPILIDIAV